MEPSRSEPQALFLFALTLALLGGQILAHLRLPSPLPAGPLLALLLLFVAALAVLAWRRMKKTMACCVLAAGALLWGYFAYHRVLHPHFGSDHLRSIATANELLYVEGRLYREPERLPDRSQWHIQGERIWLPNGAQEVAGKVLVTVRVERREWRYGDRMRVWLRLQPPRSSGNPGGFDYERHLARQGIYLTAFLESDGAVRLLSRGTWNPWSWVVEAPRRQMRRFLERHLAPEQAALMKALVVGDRGGLSREANQSFARAGVAHVLSISGLHVGMLGLVLFLAVRSLGSLSTALLLRWSVLKIATSVSFVGVVFYTALAGAMIPTVRSAIMIGVYELAVLVDREEELFGSLALAALVIGLFWPGAIMDISFQLSFLAVLFIVWGMMRLQELWPARKRDELPEERSRLGPWKRKLGLYLGVPVLAGVGTAPLLAYHFGQVSLAGFLANPLVVPLVGFVVIPLGLAAGFLSLIAPALALPLLHLAESPLSWTLTLVNFFAWLPLASFSVPPPNLIEVAILYAVLGALLVARRRVHLYWAVPIVGALLIQDGFYWRAEGLGKKELRVTFLSVGQGDAVVVELPDSQVLVIDAGGSAAGEFDPGASIVAPFLQSRRISRVHYVLVSYPRVDHYGGMKSIVERFKPSEFWSGPSAGNTSRYAHLEEAVDGLKVSRAVLGTHLGCRSIGEVRLCVLHPPEAGSVGKRVGREESVVVRLTFGEHHFLFTGDIDGRTERLLVESGQDLASHVLKIPSHGSGNASTESFVAAVRPGLAIVSAGHRNPYGFPREEVLQRYESVGARILRTDEDGAVTITTDGRNLRYQTHRSGKSGRIG